MALFLGKQTTIKPDGYQTEPSLQDTRFIQMTDNLIQQGVAAGASDIHIEPMDTETFRVRMRIDGRLYSLRNIDKHHADGLITRIKILSKMDIAEKRLPQDGSFGQKIAGRRVNIRVSTLPTYFGEKIAIRLLDASRYIRALNTLGFNEIDYRKIRTMLAKKQGLILVSGPTGCGKSTTVYSMLNALNNAGINITTIEDPIEIQMPGINQMQVNEKANLSYDNGLRAILRQDPNVIMIGEIRDEKTALAACRAALTGHLVFSTLHTRSSALTVDRLTDLNVPAYLINDVLAGVVSQRLVRLLCPKCKKSRMTTPYETKSLNLKSPTTIAETVGCEHCRQTGYHHRRAVFEVLSFSKGQPTNAPHQNITSENGVSFTPLADSIRRMILKGETSYAEGISIINS